MVTTFGGSGKSHAGASKNMRVMRASGLLKPIWRRVAGGNLKYSERFTVRSVHLLPFSDGARSVPEYIRQDP